jgi:NAD-dependent dihydropyrimidine dehydrogenase PreA subunit
MSALPVLDAWRCTGCGDCVAVCPASCLALDGSLPWLPRPADCVLCALCELVCPSDAIRIPGTQPSGSIGK